jgi:alanyl-tRNA synthetase
MEKLYYDRPYVKIFEAIVTDCRQGKDSLFEVLLDRSAFYPEGGGQPADIGTLGEAVVLDVRERPEGIVHITDKPLKAGSRVTGILDWERRFCNMQNHSGEHLLSGIVHKNYGLDNVGFHMGKDEVTVDFNGILTQEQIEAAETEVNELIWRNIPVLESYPSKEELTDIDYRSKKELTGQVRLIEFPGGDVCACCGTHVMTAGEIGILKVTGLIHYKGGVRVTMLCGGMALQDYRKKQKAVSGISVLLSAKPDLLLEAVDRLKEEGLKKDGRIGQLSKELLERKTGDYPELDAPLLVFERDLTPVQLRQFCTMLYEGKKGSVVMVCSGDEGVFQYALGSGREDMRALSKALNERLNGRGGGSALMAQGTFQALPEDIRKAFEDKS